VRRLGSGSSHCLLGFKQAGFRRVLHGLSH
jgi:hypothetical protein